MGRVKLDNLTKIFDDNGSEIMAVDDIDLEIEDGEFLVLVGPSGCGKSTTLRCIAGLERTSAGEIWVGGREVTDEKPKNRDIAMVFQNYALYPHMTAHENMSFGLKMTTDLADSEIDDRVQEAATLMGIENLLEKRPGSLSGGQQQRVALGRAIVRDPDVFLMDEPLSNLDAKLRTSMRTELQNLQQELDVTTIYVTHDQTEAMTMGDRIAVLEGGQLQQVGTPLECYHQPKNIFVASFIGSPSMNFVEPEVDDSGHEVTLHIDSFEYPLSTSTIERLESTPEEVTLGIRPEDITLATDETNSEHIISIEVTVTEPVGEVTYVYFEFAGVSFTASLPGGVPLSAGETVEIGLPEEKIHLFDRSSGESVLSRSDSLNQNLEQSTLV